MKQKGFFITGTDTGVGKTWVTLCLMQALKERGFSVLGMKPVATGGFWRDGRLVNEDALSLQVAGSFPLPYEQVNPYVFEPPVSPHIAAETVGQTIDLQRIVDVFQGLRGCTDCILVEGVGGWMVPLNAREQVAELASAIGLPVVLVVGLRLGCLNHAALTHAAIAASHVEFAGWIANHLMGDLPYFAETLRTLESMLGSPPLICLPHRPPSCQPQMHLFPVTLSDEILRVLCP